MGNQVNHQECDRCEYDHRDEAGIQDDFLGVRGKLVLPFERFRYAPQHLGELASGFTGLGQADEYLVEHGRVIGQRLGEGLAAFDGLDHRADHLAKTRRVHAVAQLGQAFEQRQAAGEHLLEMETEGDQVAPGDAGTAEKGAARVVGDIGVDQVQADAPQPQFEINEVDSLEPAVDTLAEGIDGTVGEYGHPGSIL